MNKKIIAILLVLSMLFALSACIADNGDKDGQSDVDTSATNNSGNTGETSGSSATGTGDSGTTTDSSDTADNEEDVYPGPGVKLVEYSGVVEDIFFHPVIAYPELAFDGDSMQEGIDEWMITVKEYNAILESLYEKGYIIVNMNDVWSEEYDSNGTAHMVKNTLYLPEGKKPIIISYDDVNYYEYMRENGFTYKLIIGDDGEIWSWGLDPEGKEVVSQDLDAITILNKFVKEHPDFSMHGTKGCMALTGYEGILGYRTDTDTKGMTAEKEARRQSEIEAAKPIIAELKKEGWYFGCHTWGHINLSNRTPEKVKEDMTRWMDEVGSLVGSTTLFFYPHGARPDGNDVTETGDVFKYLQGLGFRVFFSVGKEPYTKIKSDISAVICDRMHPDGTTLRWRRDDYLHLYDAAEVFDYNVRPDYGYDFS